MLHKFKYAPIAQPILAREVVRFVGEPVAAVVADSREAAEDLADPGEQDQRDVVAPIDSAYPVVLLSVH